LTEQILSIAENSDHILGTRLPRECDDIIGNVSGVYEIYPDGTSRSVSAYCNMDKTDKWTVRFCHWFQISTPV